MSDFATVAYSIETIGASTAAIQALMSAVPLPADVIEAAGLRVVSDVTPLASPVVRTIKFAFGPSVPAVVGPVAIDNEHRITGVPVAAPGLDYVLPPQVSFVGGGPDIIRKALARSFLNLQGVALDDGGAGYSASSFGVVLGGMAPPTYITKYPPGFGRQEELDEIDSTGTFPPSCVQTLRIAVQGKGYTAASKIQFNGGLGSDPLARPAQAVITSFGPHGEIVGVQLTDPGQGYIKVPEVIVVDPGHTGGGFMPMLPDPLTGPRVNPRATSAKFVKANISPVMGQGTPAKISLTIVAGIITAVAVTSPGARYNRLPQILVIDPVGTGSGAILVPRMGVGSIEMITGGQGYEPSVTATLTPAFKVNFPNGPDQTKPFFRLLQTALQVHVLSPVTSAPPVLS